MIRNWRPVLAGVGITLGAAAMAQPAQQQQQSPQRATPQSEQMMSQEGMRGGGMMMGAEQMMGPGAMMNDPLMRRQMTEMMDACGRMMSAMARTQQGGR